MKQPNLQIAPLRKRGDFLAARKGARISGRFFTVQYKQRCQSPACTTSTSTPDVSVPSALPDEDGFTPQTLPSARFGLTVTKKTGNAVERNRIKRRLRAAIRQKAPEGAIPGADYVVFAQRAVLDGEFTAIVEELAKSLDRARTLKEKAGKEKAGKEKAGQNRLGSNHRT